MSVTCDPVKRIGRANNHVRDMLSMKRISRANHVRDMRSVKRIRRANHVHDM